MLNVHNLVYDVYKGYVGERRWHAIRLAIVLIFCALVSYDDDSINSNAVSFMAVIVSVLAGFTFTALFSSHSHSTSDLPAPISESDRADFERLRQLFVNFGNRSRYFLVISVICLVFSLTISIAMKDTTLFDAAIGLMERQAGVFLIESLSFFSFVARAITVFLFAEIIYTFYRLAETIFAILESRRDYLEN